MRIVRGEVPDFRPLVESDEPVVIPPPTLNGRRVWRVIGLRIVDRQLEAPILFVGDATPIWLEEAPRELPHLASNYLNRQALRNGRQHER